MGTDKLYVAYGDEYQNWHLSDRHPTNPERALIATELLMESLGNDFFTVAPEVKLGDRELLEDIHTSDYVSQVLDYGRSGEWSGDRLDLGATALSMFAGTARLVDAMLAGETSVAFNPQGAKHHAARDESSGFCVFNDMASAALRFQSAGMKVMYIDWDVHHGDGVEDLLIDSGITTCSIHESGIYPGTGNVSMPRHQAYNWPLPSYSDGMQFIAAMDEIRALADRVKPDVVLLAAGADGHETDPLGSLQYDYADYKVASFIVADIVRTYGNKVLIGGAGGYQPLTHTPMIWSQVVSDIWKYLHDDEDVLAVSKMQAATHPSYIREYVR